MKPPSLQILSVQTAFGQHGWHCELVEGKDVLRASFSAHHTRIQIHAQSYTPINALAVVGETPMRMGKLQTLALLELLNRANHQLNLGAFEFDMDRHHLAFRITNIFERERYDADIITSMVHCAIAELDRITPYAAVVQRTADAALPKLNLQCLLEREDLIPPVPEDENYTP